MFHFLLPYWDTTVKILLNTLLVSIPEEIYLVMITLIFVGEFDYWKEDECKKIINRWDYSRILVPSVTVALLLNIARYTKIDVNIASIICLLIFYALIVITNDVLNDARPFKWMGRAFIFLIIAQISVGLIEILYIPLITYGTGVSLNQINNNIFHNFLVSLPARFIQFIIIAILVNKKRTLLKGNLLKYLFNSPVIASVISIVAVVDMIFLFVMYKAIVYDNFLISVAYGTKIVIIVGVVIFPIINMSGLISTIYYGKNCEMSEKINVNNKLEVLREEIKAYSNDGNFEDIRWKLNEIGLVIEEIANDLHTNQDSQKKGG